MTKGELIELLKDYKENKAKLTIKLKELKSARIKLDNTDRFDTSVTLLVGINNDIHSKNQISNKVLKKVEQNDKQIRNLEEKIEKLIGEFKKEVAFENIMLENNLKEKEKNI